MRPTEAIRYGALGVGMLLTMHAGCEPSGTAGFRICDTVVRTGAESPAVRNLDKGAPTTGLSTSPPPHSALPPHAQIDHHESQTEYVRVSQSCEHGATVVVTPADKTRLVRTVRAQDGRPVLIGLYPPRKAIVQAWVSGRYQGLADPDLP